MSLNKVMLIGHLGNDPDCRQTTNGTAVANFSLATNSRWTGKDGTKHEDVEWHRVVVWNKVAENVGEYLKKGSKVFVEGKLATRSYEDKEGVKRYVTEVTAFSVLFLDNIGSGTRAPHPAEAQQTAQPAAPTTTPEPTFTEDDIPF